MALIDELKALYGLNDPDEVEQMIAAPAPVEALPPPQPQQPLAATSADMASGPTDQSLGHPDVLSFVKQLEQQGAFASEKAAAPAGMKPKSASMVTETGGPDAQQRAEGVAARGQLELDNGQVDVNRGQVEAQRLAEQAAKMNAAASLQEEQDRKAEADNAKRQERLRSQQMELATQADEPINPKRYFDNMSVFSKISAIVSAGIYGYLGGQGQAPVVDSLMQMAKEDTAAQMANNAAAGKRRNAIIDQYERQYGDTTLVAKRLEADKLLTMSKRAKAEAADAKSVEIKASAEDLASKLENRVGMIHREIQEATFGKPVQTTTTFETPKLAGAGDPNKQLKEALELDALLEKRGYTKEERSSMLSAAKLSAPGGKTEAELKREDEGAKRAELSPEKQKDLRDRVDGLAVSGEALSQLDTQLGYKRNDEGDVMTRDADKTSDSVRGPLSQVAGAAAKMLPLGMDKGATQFVETVQGEDIKALERVRDRIVFGQAKAEGAGALGDSERESYRSRIPTNSVLSVQKASTEALAQQRQNYKNLVGEYGKAAVDEMLRKRGRDPAAYGSL